MRTEQHLAGARFVWVQDGASRRNQFVLFERRVQLAELAPHALLHLFADTRYRLRVNGTFVATGPGRFTTQHPEYDRHDIAPFLKTGDNIIAVEVNYYGASSYQSMPDSEPGFIAWGKLAEEDLATPGSWQAFRMEAWRPDAPAFSFAQGPIEICDTRRLGSGQPLPLVVCSGAGAPWGNLRPYAGPVIPFSTVRPKRLELAGKLQEGGRRIGFMAHDPDAIRRGQPGYAGKPWTAFATWIHAPRAQPITISAFWSNLRLNGHPVPVDTSTPWGNHGHATLALQAGWNLLVGEVEVLSENWAYCLGLPRDAEVTLHACREQTCREPLAVLASPVPREDLRLPKPDDAAPPPAWRRHDGDPVHLTPARLMAWDQPAPDAVSDLPAARLAEAGILKAEAATWCFSFAGEFLGHLVLEVEAPAGSTLDVACDDWQRADGMVALYQSNPFTDAADRFILHGGRQVVELFHPRGGKLVQVTLRAPAGSPAANLTLHDIWVRSRLTLGPDGTHFQSDHAAFNWAWPVSLRTLQSSTDEAYSDCPWRERGSYIGDTLVAVHLNALFTGDYRVAERTLRIFGQAQRPDGQLACCAPSWLRRPHEDFTLLWLIALHDHATLTGDTGLLREMGPVVERIWASPTWESHACGLWNAGGRNLFIDWGVLPEDRLGEANAVLNVLRVGARRACAGMARRLGDFAAAESHEAEAARVEQAIFQHLWHDGEGRLRNSLGGQSSAAHANTLALAFEVGTPDQRARILAYLEPRLRGNLAQGLRQGQNSGHLELYYLYFALPALARHGRPDLAEHLVADHYGYLMKLGDDTLPECFARVEHGVGSRCHSWSGAAAVYAARYILGLRPDPAGRLIFDPIVHGIQRASGRFAHPKGWIEVCWQREKEGYRVELKAPPGVEIHVQVPLHAGREA